MRRLLIPSIALAACAPAEPGFRQIANEIFVPRCATAECHGLPELKAGASLVLTADKAWANLVDRPLQSNAWPLKLRVLKRVTPGDPDASALLLTLTHGSEAPEELQMPPLDRLSDAELYAIRAWIERGAPND